MIVCIDATDERPNDAFCLGESSSMDMSPRFRCIPSGH
ncbi:MAG: hypothetical protein RL685_6973 [Pseudomonadota bacterium]|jgi:hypothetical protein